MRRRQIFKMRQDEEESKKLVGNTAVIVELPDIAKPSYKAGDCPNCGKFIKRGMYFHMKNCHV